MIFWIEISVQLFWASLKRLTNVTETSKSVVQLWGKNGSIGQRCIQNSVKNLAPFLYPMKTSENLKVF